ncbi:magnesium/cobalt transporter CorA [Microbacterium sp.]|jgi:magnesium transporter|uniref:magnesium/cobalt transporter CorA n=1 Tax=Microbacterium sp. TaxID=51671 RepID=UPI0025CFCBB8|nr:magnesium/cobalt transporter CorA [Microbacterium sp.]
MTVVDNAIYVGGHRTSDPSSLDQTFEEMSARHGMAWIGLYRPDESELREIVEEFGLHSLAVEDALSGHQRPKLDHYGDSVFIVLRPARYLDSEEEVEFGEVHVFVGPGFIVTVRHAESPDLAKVRSRLEGDPELLARGPMAVLYGIVDEVVDEYGPVVAGLENDIDEIEDQLFANDPAVARRIFSLTREVIDFQRAVGPLIPILERLQLEAESFGIDVEVGRGFRDAHDHVIRIVERSASFRTILENSLLLHATLVTQRQNDAMAEMTEFSLTQNEQVKKVSGWAAILFAPTLVGTVYGMNFDYMPELHWSLGYPMALGLMAATSLTLYTIFKRKGWL